MQGQAVRQGSPLWDVYSDARLKVVHGAFGAGLSELLRMRIVVFAYNGKGGTLADGELHVGVVAQELRDSCPELARHCLKSRRVWLEPGDVDKTEVLIVNHSALQFALVNGVQELARSVGGLQARQREQGERLEHVQRQVGAQSTALRGVAGLARALADSIESLQPEPEVGLEPTCADGSQGQGQGLDVALEELEPISCEGAPLRNGGGGGGAGGGGAAAAEQAVALAGGAREPSLSHNHVIPFSSLRFVAKCANGGFGSVSRFHWVDGCTDVAVKSLHREVQLDDRSRFEFFREIEQLKQLKHPNILQMLGVTQGTLGPGQGGTALEEWMLVTEFIAKVSSCPRHHREAPAAA